MIIVSALALVAAVVLLLAGVDPVPTWFYVFAWYPTLILLDEAAHRLDGRPLVLRDPGRAISLCAWSAAIWLVFEAANFRLDNWYYIFLPRNGIERWTGILLSFATVVPAILLAERFLGAAGLGRKWRKRPVTVRSLDLTASVALGFFQLALALAWPVTFFPQIWGATFFITEPFVFRRRPDLSLFADLARGDWARPARVMLGGLGIGLLWESYNYWARGKWVYTVPWLEGTKWFEMPPFGFVGFAFFALEAWSMYYALCSAGVAIPLAPAEPIKPARAAVATLIAVLFSVATLLGMEHWTISSVVPKLADLPGILPLQIDSLNRAGVGTPFDLARHYPVSGDSLVETASLVVARGIGAGHAEELRKDGISTVCALSRQNPDDLWARLHQRDTAKRPTHAEVRVWISAATRTCLSPVP